MIFLGFVMTGSSMFVAFIFGTMSDLISLMRQKQKEFEEIFDTANTSMANLKLPMVMQNQVRQYISQTFNSRD